MENIYITEYRVDNIENQGRVLFETAKLAKEKGFDWECKKAYIETLEHTLELSDGEHSFPHHLPRVLDNKELDEYDVFHAKAPTQSRLQKWLREVHNIHLKPDLPWIEHGWELKAYSLKGGRELFSINKYKKYISFEHVLEAGLIEALKRIKC